MRRLLSKILGRTERKNIESSYINFLAEYSSFKEASSHGDYNNEEIANIVSQKTKQNLIDKPSTCNLNSETVIKTILCFEHISRHFEKLKVLEFGGACGANYYLTKNFFEEKISEWKIIETEKMCVAASKIRQGNQPSFETTYNNSELDFNFILLEGVIQYMDTPFELLKNIIKNQKGFIYISRLPLAKGRNDTVFYVDQTDLLNHGPGLIKGFTNQVVKTPIQLISKNEFDDFVASSNVTTIFSFPESILHTLNLKGREPIIYNWNSILLKIN